MSDSTTQLDLIADAINGQTQANAMLDAASPAMLFGRRASTTGGLTWGYYGGDLILDGTPTLVANGTVDLRANVAQFVEAAPVSTTTAPITGITAANPCVVTSVAHPYSVGDVVYISGVGGMLQMNGVFAKVASAAADTVTLDFSSVGFTAYISGGTLRRMTDNGAFSILAGRVYSAALICPLSLYQVTTGSVTITSYSDYRTAQAFGSAGISVAGSANVLLNATQWRRPLINLTGELTGNIAVVLPPLSGRYVVRNATTGAFTLTVRTPAGTGLTVAAGDTRVLACDGIDISGTT